MTPGNLSQQILGLPSGAGAVRSAGETFQADPYTGTGRYAVPIEVQPGHAGIQPALSLGYSTHGGNGIAGLGWSLGIASVTRRTDRGLPSYDDTDTFALQGDELVHVGGGTYRHRVEARFARIRHVTGNGRDFWVVTERDGTRVFYGEQPDHRVHDGHGRIAGWLVSRKQDVHGNEVSYTYARDATTRATRLTRIDWGGCYRVVLTYEDRPDPVQSTREGFARTQDQRLKTIDVQVIHGTSGLYHTYRSYELSYTVSTWTGRSLLTTVTVTGIDADDNTHVLPELTFGYTDPSLSERVWHDVIGAGGRSLSDPDVSLVRQSGSGLPDLLVTSATGHRLQENLGDGSYTVARTVSAPARTLLGHGGTFISDMSGDGWGDLVVNGGTRVYRGVAGGGWGAPYTSAQAPSVDLDDPNVRLADLTGDGTPDALRSGPSGWTFFENLGEGRWGPAVRVLRAPSMRLDDPRVHFVDVTGDGMSDLVYVTASTITVYPGLGRGQFGTPFRLKSNPLGARFDPRAVRWLDITGSGQADLVYEKHGAVQVAFNRGGTELGPLQALGARALSSKGHVEQVDLFGTGSDGLLFTDEGPWKYLEIFPGGSPDLLRTIDNGMGATTTLRYGSSGAHWARDRRAGSPWKTAMPSAQRVVDAVTTTDTVTGITLGVTYRYHHGVYDGVEREFRGFAMVEQIDREADAGDPQPLSQVLVKRWYHTGLEVDLRHEYAALIRGAVEDQIPQVPWARRSLRGRVRREETFALDGTPRPYQVSETAYRVFPVQRWVGSTKWSFAPLPILARTTHLERGPSHDERVVDTATTYDLHTGTGYGLPVEVRETGYGRRGAYTDPHEVDQTAQLERYTTTTYLHLDEPEPADYSGSYTPVYVVGKPHIEEKYAVDSPSDVLLAKTKTWYDGSGATAYQGLGYPGSGTTLGLTKGMPTCKWVLALTDSLITSTWPAGAGDESARTGRGNYKVDGTEHYIESERLKYTAEGLVDGIKDPNGNESSITYDATYDLFPTKAEDARDNPTDLTRGDLPFQVASVVDANGNTTGFTYDPSGLPESKSVQGKFVSSAWQGDPPTHPTEAYSYDFTSVPVKILVKTRQVRLGATFDVHRYLDGLGQTVQERHTAEPSAAAPSTPRFRVTGHQERNHKGLVVKAWQPSMSTSSAYAAAPTSGAVVTTTYDPLGRPVRVDYPDGTFETTDYHPWVQTLADRNDNAGHLDDQDATYGDVVDTFASHVDTPTRKYVDALGRDIAVSEDNGTEITVKPTFRITTYQIEAGAFTGTSYDLELEEPLSTNYFVLVQGSVNATTPRADNLGVRVTKDPHGTGDLAAHTSNNVLTLAREDTTDGDWQGIVTVWECLGDSATSGFELVDVKEVAPGSHTTGGTQTTSATANTAWSDLGQVALYGGPRGGGSTTTATTAAKTTSLQGRLTPSGTDSIELVRHGGGQDLDPATFAVYVVEWGSEHSIQRVTVTGNNGGAGLDATGEYDTATLTQVDRDETWCWMSGYTETEGAGEAFSGLVLALGDGVTQNATETQVAVGSRHTVQRSCLVTVHSHASLAVDWRFQSEGNGTATTHDHTVDALPADADEFYDEDGTLLHTFGSRAGVLTPSNAGTGSAYEDALWFARHTAGTTLGAERFGSSGDWAAWVQSIDTVGVTYATRRYHVTRSVLDLSDQVLEVWDARELADATWEFTYDLAGRRTVSWHRTALGKRYALADAAGNPIWSRDARDIEVDRTFDALNRPLDEKTDDGTTVKLRRMWTYVGDWDALHADHSDRQTKNLYGQVEEARDADGVRFFEYDWRGLVTKASHKFWDIDWTNGSASVWTQGASWDPAVSDKARDDVSLSWLTLDDLDSNTDTATIETDYDAAGRPIEVRYPEEMKTDNAYNEAGLLETVRVHRTNSEGWQVVVEDLAYNARGQPTYVKHGNGVETDREYDADLERLTRIFTREEVGTQVDFQDLRYSYDPVGNPVEIEDKLADSLFADNSIIPNTRTFAYDPRYRLVKATGKKHKDVTWKSVDPHIPSPSANDYEAYAYKYRYDEVGNFTKNHEYSKGTIHYKATRIDLFNGDGKEAIDDDPTAGNWKYDANGNCTHSPRHEEMAYTHDNQMRFVDLNGGGEVRYLRHGDQRVVRLVNKTGVKALGVYLGPWEYHQRDATTDYTKTVLHVEGHGRHAQAEVVLAGTDSDSLDLFFQHSDHLGSGHSLTKDDGTLLSQEEFFPYGRASDRRDERNRYRYIGVERDEDTGFCMTGPRTYDPVTGRFLQGDPVVAPAPFSYSSANPVGRSDANGYQDYEQGPLPESHQWPQETIESQFPTGGQAVRPESVSGGVVGEVLGPALDKLAPDFVKDGLTTIAPYLDNEVVRAAEDAFPLVGAFKAGRWAKSLRHSPKDGHSAASKGAPLAGTAKTSGQGSGLSPPRLARGQSLERYFVGDSLEGLMAQLDLDGTLHLYIAAGKNTPRGGQMFNEAIEAFGANNIQAIKGSWRGGGDLAANFDAYKAAVANKVPPKQAALHHTFTGHMAKKHGFTEATILKDNARLVEPLFTRPK